MRWQLERPPRERLLRICAAGSALIILALMAVLVGRIAKPPADWLATTSKYVGLIVASLLGVIGTATDTKEKRDDGGYKLRPIGWVVACAIVVALIIGAFGQYFDDKSKKTAESAQIGRLESLAALARQSMKRYSGKIEADVEVEFDADQPLLRNLSVAYEKQYPEETDVMRDMNSAFPDDMEAGSIEKDYQSAFQHVNCFVTLSNAAPPGVRKGELMTMDLVVASPTRADVTAFDHKRRVVRATLHTDAEYLRNYGIYSATDFAHRYVQINYSDVSSIDETNKGNLLVRDELTGDVTKVTFIDGELKTVLGSASLRLLWCTSNEDVVSVAFGGTTSRARY